MISPLIVLSKLEKQLELCFIVRLQVELSFTERGTFVIANFPIIFGTLYANDIVSNSSTATIIILVLLIRTPPGALVLFYNDDLCFWKFYTLLNYFSFYLSFYFFTELNLPPLLLGVRNASIPPLTTTAGIRFWGSACLRLCLPYQYLS